MSCASAANISRLSLPSLALALVLLLAACGGAGGSSSNNSNPNNPPPQTLQPAKFAYLCQTSIGFQNTGSGAVQIPTAITAFNVDASTGALTQMAGSPIPSGICSALAATPDGKFLYLSNQMTDMSGMDKSAMVEYAIAADGTLTLIGSVGTTAAWTMQVAPSGKFLYSTSAVTGPGPSALPMVQTLGFQIGPSGTLSATTAAPPAMEGTPRSSAFAPSGKFLYVSFVTAAPPPCVSACQQAKVAAYTVDQNTGALTPVSGSPFNVGPGFEPSEADIPAGGRIALVVDAQSRSLYVPNSIFNNVFGFAIDAASGALTSLPGSPFGSNLFLTSGAADPAGKFIYAAGGFKAGPGIAVFSMDSSGALTPVAGSPFSSAQQSPEANRTVVVDPTGKFLYAVNFDFGFVTAFSVSSSGTFTEIAGSPFSTPEMNGTNPAGLVLVP